MKKRILWITNGLPYPPHSGFRQHDFHLITQVAQHYSIVLCSLLEFAEETCDIEEMRRYCEDVHVVVAHKRSFEETVKGASDSLLKGRPLATHAFYYESLATKIRQIAMTQQIALVQIEHSFFAPYITCLPEQYFCKTVLSLHNLGVRQYRSMLNLNIGLKEKVLFLAKWLLMLRWETEWTTRFDRILTVSSVEAGIIRQVRPTLPISVIENGIDTQQYKPLPEPADTHTLLFVGTMGYPPNVDAVLWFCREILPHIQQQIPDVKLLVVGHHPSPEILKLSECKPERSSETFQVSKQPYITVTGHVPDVRPYYQQASVCIVPLRAGGGTRLKILEAMALGRPVISTSSGCEGLDVQHGRELLIADAPSKFAELVIELLQSRTLRELLITQARDLVAKEYDWKVIGQKLVTIYEQLLKR